MEHSHTTISKCIIDDDKAIEVIIGGSYLGIYKESLAKLFKEFQRSYRSGFYYQNQDKYHRNNEDVIDHFCKWCLSPKNKKAIPRTDEVSKMMDYLKNEFLKIYHD